MAFAEEDYAKCTKWKRFIFANCDVVIPKTDSYNGIISLCGPNPQTDLERKETDDENNQGEALYIIIAFAIDKKERTFDRQKFVPDRRETPALRYARQGFGVYFGKI